MNNNQPPWLMPRAVYIHIPFCAHHCGYCDFAVSTGQEDKIDSYLMALEKELGSILCEPHAMDSIFLGGGTPTYLNFDQLNWLLSLILQWFPPKGKTEFSIEANPGTLTKEKIDLLIAKGVNRISLGTQTFHPHLLTVLERDHQPRDVEEAVHLIRRHQVLLSLDLIFGIPGQTLDQLEEDLTRAVNYDPDHISTYGLTFEKGTRLWKQMRQGEVQPLAEESELDMYLLAMDFLSEEGFDQYEISNFGRPGKECRHNQVYWANEAFFGFGMGAASYVEAVRRLNTRDLWTYLTRLEKGISPVFQSEELLPEDLAREIIGQNLRRKMGINKARFEEQSGFNLYQLVGEQIRRFLDTGHLLDDGSNVFLSREGKCLADVVIQEFWRK